MDLRFCPNCGLVWAPKADWERTCISCWKEERGYKLTKSDEALVRLQRHATDLYKASKVEDPPPESEGTLPGLDEKKVRALIKLCHPDRHQGRLSGLANRVTVWLIKVRKELE